MRVPRHLRAVGLLAGFVLLALAPLRAADKTAKVSGTVFTIGPDQVQTVWPNARVTLKNKQTQAAVSTVTGERGEYGFFGLESGEYEITAVLAGFEPETRAIQLEPKADLRLDIELHPKKQAEEVVVQAEKPGVDTSTTSTAGPTLGTNLLQSGLVSDRFQDALPLLPGVVRGPDGLINIKGGRANQGGTLVNSTSVTDPVTGLGAISLPLEVVSSVRVLSNPFSAKYGRFAGGVVELDTVSGTDVWKFQLRTFTPRFQHRNGHLAGVQAETPRLTLSGPLVKGKLYFLQSFQYRFVRTPVPSLPELTRNQVLETFDSVTQVDWNITPNHRLSGTASVYPQNLSFVNLNTFNPLGVTPDFRQRGYFVAGSERSIFSHGGFLFSSFSVKRYDAHVFPASPLSSEMDLFPEQNFGAYFNRQDRESRLYQWSQSYSARPLKAHGTHVLQIGYSYARSNYQGAVNNLPVVVLREDHTTAQRITEALPGALHAAKNDLAFFFQDTWQVHPRFTLDLGARFDRDDLSNDPINAAPRFGFVFAPTRDNKTAVRGGVGVFYDKIPLNVATFLAYPAQVVTRFAADGVTVADGPITFLHTVATPNGRLHVPYSLGGDFQVDRDVGHGLMFRFGYEQRETHRDFVVDPVRNASTGVLRLQNDGRQSYREFQWTLRWQPSETTTVFASYVRSRATGDLNVFDQYFGNYPNPILRPNQRGLLPYDAPNRFLLWGLIDLPWKIVFGPTLEVRDGFPFSKVDDELNFVGPRNAAGRFPVFFAWDIMLSRKFTIPFRHKRYTFNTGFRIYNVTNHNNPRDVQQNVFSPNFGQFYNSAGPLFRFKFEMDF